MGIINEIKKRGFRATLFSTGKTFDPHGQKKTSAKRDILKNKRRKDRSMLDKIFGIK